METCHSSLKGDMPKKVSEQYRESGKVHLCGHNNSLVLILQSHLIWKLIRN